jgi:hypothetical protein
MKNEVYWVHYVLRDLLAAFDRVVLLDTGSTDGTQEVARATEKLVYRGRLDLIQVDFGDDPFQIGNSPNILRDEVKTWWMLLLAGDEILPAAQIKKLAEQELSAHKYKVGMITGHNVAPLNGGLAVRDAFCADKFFDPTIQWVATEYPFEGYNQHLIAAEGQIHYLDATYWHVRNCIRSPYDEQTYFRHTKADYFPFEGEYTPLPKDWIGEVTEFLNPYLEHTSDGHHAGDSSQE